MIIINDVGPRDGLQSQQKILTPDERFKLIEAIAEAGVSHIEVGAFVSPKAVPAMAETDQVLAQAQHLSDVTKTVLIPNQKGYELARDAGAKRVAMVLYASESMAMKNVNMSAAESEVSAKSICAAAQRDGIEVVFYIAVSFACPFDGHTDPNHIAELTSRYMDYGVEQIVYADTIGAANPLQVAETIEPIVGQHGSEKLACHFHDTRAMGLANVYAAYQFGIKQFDASIGGLGGCPFAPGASGNVATEDVVMMFDQMGEPTNIDLAKLLKASDLAIELTGTAKGGRARSWLDRQHAVTQS